MSNPNDPYGVPTGVVPRIQPLPIARPDVELEAQLPEGWDIRTRMAVTPGGQLIIAHPDHHPMIYDRRAKVFVKLEGQP